MWYITYIAEEETGQACVISFVNQYVQYVSFQYIFLFCLIYDLLNKYSTKIILM